MCLGTTPTLTASQAAHITASFLLPWSRALLGCLGVFTLPCEHRPPVFIHTARNKGKQIKKRLGLFPSAVPQSTEHPACSTAETCCSCSSLLGTACLARASSCFRSWYPHHTEIQSPLCLIYHCAWL